MTAMTKAKLIEPRKFEIQCEEDRYLRTKMFNFGNYT